MPRVPTVRKADLDRVLQALRADGQTIGRVEIEPGGKVTILLGKPEATLTPLERGRLEREKYRAAQRRQSKPTDEELDEELEAWSRSKSPG